MSVIVTRGNDRISINSLSEGEAQRVDLACFFALSHLIQYTLDFPVDFCVLDEPLNGLDSDGKSCIFDIIMDLSGSKQVIVIDHDGNFKDRFEDVIKVQKDEMVSTVL